MPLFIIRRLRRFSQIVYKFIKKDVGLASVPAFCNRGGLPYLSERTPRGWKPLPRIIYYREPL